MTENGKTTEGWDKVAGEVFDLSGLTRSKLTTSKLLIPLPYKNSVQCDDQILATTDEWTGVYTITTQPEARGGIYYYMVQPGRHEPGRITQEEAFLIAVQADSEDRPNRRTNKLRSWRARSRTV